MIISKKKFPLIVIDRPTELAESEDEI